MLIAVLSGSVNCNSPKKINPIDSSDSAPVIVWDRASLKQLAEPAVNTGQNYFSYPRMIETSAGVLFCVFEHNGNIGMVTSYDKGSEWSSEKIITSSRNRINVANPEIIELMDGDMIVAYNLRPQANVDGSFDPSKKFSICVKRSSDKGVTWGEEQLLYQAGAEFKNGCWEPAMVQLPNGQIQLFFANEAPFTSSDEQDISMLTSDNNGESWSTVPVVVSFAKNYRDGMPVPLFDEKNDQVLLAIEDNSEGGQFNPSVIKLGAQPYRTVDAKNPDRVRLLEKEISENVYAGAPYIKKFTNGTIALSVQSTLNRNSDWRTSTMDVAVGKDLQSVRLTARPFDISLNKSALWNALCITKDDSIIALTSTNAFNDYTAIWMVKGKLK